MTLSQRLLAWYDQCKRTLPWRGTHDPYSIWLSEIMLQQTRTETVCRYYPRFLGQFPTVFDLANAPEDTVLKLWEGLGYYSRARNLHAAAKQVAFLYHGTFPTTAAELRKLPGIGPYAANAIASIAYGECVPALDGNQARVLTRVFAYAKPLKTPFDLLNQAMEVISSKRPGDYNQALMDLGASICTSKKPDCEHCPLTPLCLGHQLGNPEAFPQKISPITKKEVSLSVILAFVDDRILVRRRPSTGLLGGLYEFPMLEGFYSSEELPLALEQIGLSKVSYVRSLPNAKHVFTHLIWKMEGHIVQLQSAPNDWLAVDNFDEVAIPSALRKYRDIAWATLQDKIKLQKIQP